MSEIIKKLDIGIGGLRITDNKRNLNGCIRYKENNLEIYTGKTQFDNKGWTNIMPKIANKNNLGLIKIGNNLKINDLGVLSSISTSKSQIYQHIIHISPNTYNDKSNDIFKSDFTHIHQAIEFLNNLDEDIFKLDINNQWIIKLCPGNYYENNIILPSYVSIQGYGNENTFIKTNKIVLGNNSSIKDLSLNISFNIIVNNPIINSQIILSNLIIEQDYLGDNFINLIEGKIIIKDCRINLNIIKKKNDCKINIIDLGTSSKLEILNTNIFIVNPNNNTAIINTIYSDILIKNSNLILDIDLDLINDDIYPNDVSLIKNLYSNIEIYNSELENKYLGNNNYIINTIEDEIYFTELIEQIQIKQNNIISFQLDEPIINDIKGFKIQNTKLKINKINKKNNNFNIKFEYLENGILNEGNYSDIIIELLYKIKVINSYIRGSMEKNINLGNHYFLEKFNSNI